MKLFNDLSKVSVETDKNIVIWSILLQGVADWQPFSIFVCYDYPDKQNRLPSVD